MLLASSALALGFVHGLGADHLMAIAALSTGGAETARGRAFGVALRFACGHAILLVVGAMAVVVAGWQVSSAVERGGEMVGGALLVGLGAAGLWAVATGRVYGHAHVHGDPLHDGWHLHVGASDRHPGPGAHTHLPTILGAVFAISGLRALTLLAPLGTAGTATASLLTLLGLIAVFAAGIMLAMCLFGVVLARVLSSRALVGVGRAAAGLTAVASVGLGCYWLASV
ncbi:MAG: hypothetical protein QF463_14355 [Vicinamibacterales bacterium]|jgi:hypothetical protein|nr:hypothetical protein [Acidobacteriota bacterium]MDP6372964.1 hypothetical protein [Vicinamibacterales bacterium]MDP6610244.1 hypothetical protein [Vicinamibacterales bacterium]HAK56177.1 hypothetical protein [Acidobacteriota bacterium]|tara:strand:- start:7216 stop:7896 length:681 start_codon:yes stop_codon:yes gene_type:complete